MKNYPLQCALLASATLLQVGCFAPPPSPSTRTVRVEAVNRLGEPTPVGSYVVRSRTGEESLRFREAARHVRTALSGRGLFEAPANVTPDLVIEIDFGMTPTGLKQETVVLPVYSQVASELPEIIGYRAVVYPVAHHDKYLTVIAHIRRVDGDERPSTVAWRVQASIQDEKADIRACLPLLAAAVMEQLAADTNGTEEIKLSPSDPLVAFIRKGI